LDVLNRGLLSLINAARPLGFATALANQASLLRGDLADLYFFIRHYIDKMQKAWFDHKDFDQFTKTPSANLVLHHPYGSARLGSLRGHIDRVSYALASFDKVLLIPCESFLADHSFFSLQPLLSRMPVTQYLNHYLIPPGFMVAPRSQNPETTPATAPSK
jgi:hypothetical protein